MKEVFKYSYALENISCYLYNNYDRHYDTILSLTFRRIDINIRRLLYKHYEYY